MSEEEQQQRRRLRRRRKKKEDESEATPTAEAKDEAAEAEEKEAEEAPAAEAEEAPAEEAEAPAPTAEEAEKAGEQAEPEEPGDADAEAEAEGEEGEAEAEPVTRRRRGSEVTTTPARKTTTPAPRTPDGAIAVRARAKYVRCAPRKARLVVDHIRGRSVEQARAILRNTPRAASRDVLKLLDSAVANAENNHELVADELVVGQVYVDEGPTLKRYRPRALGRATRIRKRTSHMTITLTTNDGKAG
jgi:ribosomal protein L22